MRFRSGKNLVKYSLGKIHFPTPVDQFIPQQRERDGISTLALEEAATRHLPTLPALHKDPFDRMLICQAIQHELTILTPRSTHYPICRLNRLVGAVPKDSFLLPIQECLNNQAAQA